MKRRILTIEKIFHNYLKIETKINLSTKNTQKQDVEDEDFEGSEELIDSVWL